MKIIKGEDDVLELFTAKDAMIKPVFIQEDEEAKEIVNKLKKEDINVCIVINKNKEFIGQISDDDLIKLFLKQIKNEPLTKLNLGYIKDIDYKKARDLTNKNKLKVREITPINEVIKLMFKRNINHISVISNKNKVLGVITTSSIIDLLKDK